MLDKTHITQIEILSEEWYRERLAKFTASEWSAFMGEKFLTTGAKSYIYRKVGEEVSGIACKDEVDTKATEHGKLFEEAGIRAFGKEMNCEFVVTQKLITKPGSRYGCTPDFLMIIGESTDEKFWNVATGEVKCPSSYDAYIKLAICDSPGDVRKAEPKYYWQVLMQMKLCNCLVGYLVIYQPYFKVGGLNIIEFRKKNLLADFKLLEERMILAEEEFGRIRDKLFNSKFNKYNAA